jgi:hypothetical protein
MNLKHWGRVSLYRFNVAGAATYVSKRKMYNTTPAGHWGTAKDGIIPMVEMTNDHLYNAWRLAKRKGWKKFKELDAEVKRRERKDLDEGLYY